MEPKNGVLKRSAADETKDGQFLCDNLLNEAWKDWPNEAGFQGLSESRGPIELNIKGCIPEWAAGVLYRTGPGLNTIQDTSRGIHSVSHWFDGFAQIHKFEIIADDSAVNSVRVSYSCRLQSQDYIDLVRTEGWRASISFGQRSDPCIGIFAKAMSHFRARKNNNNVVPLPNLPNTSAGPAKNLNLFISTDTATLQELNPSTLEPIGFTNQTALHPDLEGSVSCAHPQRDPVTGDWFNFNLDFGRRATYRVFRVDAESHQTEILATVIEPEVSPAYIHSFFLTNNYAVLCIPTSHYAWSGLKIFWTFNVIDAIKPFEAKIPCRWLVIDRKHGRGVVGRFTTPAGFFFHSSNAFEEIIETENGGKQIQLNLECVQYENTDILRMLYYDIMMDRDDAMKKCLLQDQRYKTCQPSLVRYRYNLPGISQTTGLNNDWLNAPEAEKLFEFKAPHAGDLPVINPQYTCKRHKFVYAVNNRGLSTFMDSIVKTDVETGDVLIWCGGKSHSPGEPIFIARPGKQNDEDDGVLLSVVLDGEQEASYLVCLDAKTLLELGRAEAKFAIAFGFHGAHVGST